MKARNNTDGFRISTQQATTNHDGHTLATYLRVCDDEKFIHIEESYPMMIEVRKVLQAMPISLTL